MAPPSNADGPGRQRARGEPDWSVVRVTFGPLTGMAFAELAGARHRLLALGFVAREAVGAVFVDDPHEGARSGLTGRAPLDPVRERSRGFAGCTRVFG